MGAVLNVSDTVSTSADEAEKEVDPLDSIFCSQESVNLDHLPKFNSTDLSAAAAAMLAYPDDHSDNEIEMLSATTTSASSDADEEELSDFLWDTFDPAVQEVM